MALSSTCRISLSAERLRSTECDRKLVVLARFFGGVIYELFGLKWQLSGFEVQILNVAKWPT
jgi:hypothetical protein